MKNTVLTKLCVDSVTKLPGGKPRRISEPQIADRITTAVMEHRLAPGTKLPEHALCDAFGTGRAGIRRVLLMLAERGIVDLKSNRGAFIASPSSKEAKDVFQARRAVESAVIESVVPRITEEQISSLRARVDKEILAARSGDREASIRLSGRFHVELADFADNPVLARFVEQLVARTSLIIGLFGSSRLSSCPVNEHQDLIAAIASRDRDRTKGLIVSHLNHIESDLDLSDAPLASTDLREIFDRQ